LVLTSFCLFLEVLGGRASADANFEVFGDAGTNASEIVFGGKFAVFEDNNEAVFVGIDGTFGDGDEVVIIADEYQSTFLARLARVGHWVLVDLSCNASNNDLACLAGKLEGVAVDLLEQSTTRAERDIVGAPTCLIDGFEDVTERFVLDAIALNHADVGWQNLETLFVDGETEATTEGFEDLRNDFGRLARVGPNHQCAVAAFDGIFELRTPEVFAGVEDVEAVGDDGDESVGELEKHIAESICFPILAPARNGRVLGGGNRKTCHVRAVVTTKKHESGHRVRAEERREMSSTTDGCRFDRSRTAKAEVVELEADIHVAAGEGCVVTDDLLHFVALGGDGYRIPQLHEQGFHVVRKPEAVRIGVFDNDQNVLAVDDGAFWHCLDFERKPTAVLAKYVLPALAVEDPAITEVSGRDFGGFVDHPRLDYCASEVLLKDVLQTEENGLVPLAAAALDVAVDDLGIGRVLDVMADLVAVGQKDKIFASHGV